MATTQHLTPDMVFGARYSRDICSFRKIIYFINLFKFQACQLVTENLTEYANNMRTCRNYLEGRLEVHVFYCIKKGKRKVQGVPQSQTVALHRPQEEEETDKSKQAQSEQIYEKH